VPRSAPPTPDFYFERLQQVVIDRGQQRLLALIAETVEHGVASAGEGSVAAGERTLR